MVSFNEFLVELGPLKSSEIPFYFRNQFKIKENFINPSSRHFEAIAQKLLMEDKSGIKRKWDKQCKMLFIWVLVKFFQSRNKRTINPIPEEWHLLSQILNIEELTLKQRWITLINPLSKSINWDPEEDEIIKSLMQEQEEKHIWTTIALELYNQNNGQFVRTPKQVRERWMNYLNPKLRKSNWSFVEDLQLLQLVVKHGKRWSLISSLLEGRTENQVKNRFKSLIHKIYKEEDDDDIEELQAIKDYLRKFSNSEHGEQHEIDQKQQNRFGKKNYKRQVKQRKSKQLESDDESGEQFERQPVKLKQEDEIPAAQNHNQQQPLQQIQLQSQLQAQAQTQPLLQLPTQQQQAQIVQQLQQQYCMSVQATCDTRSQENRKDLSTPISMASLYPPVQGDEGAKAEQFKQLMGGMGGIGNQQNRQMPVQSPIYQFPSYSNFRPYQSDSYQDLLSQQTPVQLNRVLLEQCLKSNFYQYQQGLVSPFPQQTPMVYTPMQYYYPSYFTHSPSIMVRSPFTEGSPSIKNQQYMQWAQQNLTNPQIGELELKQEQAQHEQFNSKLEFLKSSNLVDAWKSKRDALKHRQVSEQ